ncbi:MAG: type IV pilus assembly protein PilM, partial [Deltaproteobacteria bacterium]|nr:type IV pilus assembly protein PilM [Deltaproteobacteria bacterium]
EKGKGQRQLVRFGYHPLPAQTIVDGNIMSTGEVVEGLNRLFHDLKIKDREIALSVSGHSVIIKKITMPLMTPAELREQIPWEAEQHIPFDIKDVQVDYEVVRRRQDQGQMDVLLVAAKKEEIHDLTSLAVDAKLRVRVVDIDAFALQNCFELNYGLPQGKVVALLNVGASLTTLNVISDGTSGFTRDITNGGNAITEEIQKQLGISHDEAEAYKVGGEGTGIVPAEVARVIQGAVESLAGEIQRSLDFYLATSGDRAIDHIFVAGGTANIHALLEAIGSRARVPVEALDPLRQIPPDTKQVNPNALRGRIAQSVVALGLALRKDREKAS